MFDATYNTKWLLWSVGMAMLFLGLHMNGEATVLRYLPAEELVGEADEVIHGRVASVETKWTASRNAIYTEVVLDIIEVFKGQGLRRDVSFTFLGGECDGVRMFYEHQPSFVVDEEVLVFLRMRDQAKPLLMALSQGVWRVKQDVKSVLGLVFERTVRGIGTMVTPEGTTGPPGPRSVSEHYSVSDLRRLVGSNRTKAGQKKGEVGR